MVWNSDKISPWGPAEPDATNGDDLSLFEAFHGPATTGPTDAGGNVLRQLYSGNPTYFAPYLKPDVQLNVETSLGWPLDLRSYGHMEETRAGWMSILPIGPPDSSHWIITHLYIRIAGEVGAGKFVETVYKIVGGSPSAGIPGSTITLHRYEITHNERVGIIGSYTSDQTGSYQASCFGIRPLYLPHPHSLEIRIGILDGIGEINAGGLYLQLPESQPFGSLIGSL